MRFRLVESKEDRQRFIDKFGQELFDKFTSNSIQTRLKNNGLSNDMVWYTKNVDKEALKQLLSKVERRISVTNKDLKTNDSQDSTTDGEIRGRYKYLGEKNGYKVYQPLDALASMDLGYMTGWCTTGRYGHAGERNFKPSLEKAEEHFDEYTERGVKLFYFLDSRTMEGEYAIALLPSTLTINKSINRSFILKETNIEIYNQNDDIDYSAFESLPTELIPYDFVFEYEKLPEFKIEDGVLIRYNGIKDKVVIPNGVKEIDYKAFSKCKSLTSVVFEKGSQLTSIREFAFEYCTSLKTVTIPNSVKTIDYNVFDYCTSLTSVTFENNSQLESIGEEAFKNCTSLTSITIPDSVTSIERWAFWDCTSLKTIKYGGTIEDWKRVERGKGWAKRVSATKVLCLGSNQYVDIEE